MTESEQLAEIKELIQNNNQRLEERLDHLETTTDGINEKLKEIYVRFREFDIRIETYQKASQQVVNLAFSLIIATAAAIVIPAVFGK
ncbi:MAG: hypothetical protein QNJ33_08565 [Crocosphaera sp.]|nr:hypothetical protein [Crocosphaera sp.]